MGVSCITSGKLVFKRRPSTFFLFTRITLFFLLSKSATDVKVTADMVREALEEAEKAQIAAEKAIKQADEDIQGTQNLLTSVRDCSHCCVWEKHTHTYICQERSTSDHYL